jgi:peptidyl-prolyl cis-trans isomerase B (cyclophilin B)
MAKRQKHTPQRSHVYQVGQSRPGFSRKDAGQPTKKSGPNWGLIASAAVVVVVLAGVGAYYFNLIPGFGSGGATPAPTARPSFAVQPPSATPLADPPAEPSGDGTTATIQTELGDIEIELYTESSPVAAENFINLAEAGYYDGVGFHRLVPGFMIQGGDPEGTGGGGPGYTISDEPIVGEYTRGTVAMARTSAPDSQGSQFFIVVDDSDFLAQADPGYAIFGTVVSGMEVVDEIVGMPTAGDDPGGTGGTALDPVPMITVTIDRP